MKIRNAQLALLAVFTVFAATACRPQPQAKPVPAPPAPPARAPDSGARAPDPTPVATPPTPRPASAVRRTELMSPSCTATTEDPFACVRDGCRAVGGAFSERESLCRCPRSDQIFVAYYGGRCLTLNGGHGQAQSLRLVPVTRNGRSDPANDPLMGEAFSTSDSQETEGLGGASLSLTLAPSLSAQATQKIAMILASSSITPPSLPMLPVGGGEIRILIGQGGHKFLADLMENLTHREIRQSPTASTFQWSPRVLFERDTSRLAQILTHSDDPAAAHLGVPAGQDQTVLSAASSAYASLSRGDGHLVRVQFFARSGCAGHCRLFYDLPVPAPFRAQEVRQYTGGTLLHRQILISSAEASEPSAVIEIDPTGAPNLVYRLESIAPEGHWLRQVRIYDREGQLLGETLLDLRLDPGSLDAYRNRIAAKAAASDSVVVCEDGFEGAAVAANPQVAPYLRLGPYLARGDGTRTGSAYGWLENREGSLAALASGVSYLNDYGLPDRAQSYVSHSQYVAAVIAEKGDASVIPLGSEQCLRHYSDWKRPVRAAGVRVVNISRSWPLDARSCEESSFIRTSVDDPERPFLWVVSAGNDGTRWDRREDHPNCPQNLAPRANLVVVTAASGGQIAGYADNGRFYSDILAPDHTLDGKNFGSSFAAPRVSRVAARIARLHPNFAPEQIRQALILGAKIDFVNSKPRFQAVRSGGYLDEAGALAVAQILEKLGPTPPDAAQILREFRCARVARQTRSTCENGVQDQIKWLKDGQAL